MTILLTGFTGNIGVEVARQLAGHHVLALMRNAENTPRIDGITIVEGSLESVPNAVRSEVETIVHCAASTAFKSPLAELRHANVDLTACLLSFARGCPRLRKFIHVSTICVVGDACGSIPEAPVVGCPGFVNPYEQSKWEAERIVLASDLPVEIVRLAIVAGSERDGSVRRPGALHHALYWLYKGLIPMIPGTPDSRVDLVSTEFAASVIGSSVHTAAKPGRIVHASSGESAPTLDALLTHLVEFFARHHRGWASGSVTRPDIVDAHTFALFEASVRQSGDALFQRVCDDALSFLPGLLYPRIFDTSLSRAVPSTGWRPLVSQVAGWLIKNNWGRAPKPIPSHAIA